MRVKSNVKAGGGGWTNHNQSVKGLKVRSKVKSGGLKHSQTAARRALEKIFAAVSLSRHVSRFIG